MSVANEKHLLTSVNAVRGRADASGAASLDGRSIA